MTLEFRSVAPSDLAPHVPDLAALLVEAVRAGAGMGFLAPLSIEEAVAYWRSLRPEIEDGRRVLLVGRLDDRVVATGQLELAPWPNARHRAEVQKLIVRAGERRQGFGRMMMAAIHDAARAHGRSLLILGTRRGGPAEDFYRSLGYQAWGMLPGYEATASGERHDNTRFYIELR